MRENIDTKYKWKVEDIFEQNKKYLESLEQNKKVEIKQQTIEIKRNLTLVGQALNTFLILEDGADLYFVDQHAAHERFIFDKLNTWYDLRLILTAKTIPDAEPKTNYVDLDGMDGSLDLSEVLTGEITYNDRTISATFWTDYGTFKDREALLRKISASLHGKKVKIIEPDDPDHYFIGRVKIKSKKNKAAYAEFTIEAICEPWRYAINECFREIDTQSNEKTNVVINNHGVKTLCPTITVNGSVKIHYENLTVSLVTGTYKISDLKLRQGFNVVGVSGYGSVTLSYREADL